MCSGHADCIIDHVVDEMCTDGKIRLSLTPGLYTALLMRMLLAEGVQSHFSSSHVLPPFLACSLLPGMTAACLRGNDKPARPWLVISRCWRQRRSAVALGNGIERSCNDCWRMKGGVCEWTAAGAWDKPFDWLIVDSVIIVIIIVCWIVSVSSPSLFTHSSSLSIGDGLLVYYVSYLE